MNCFILSVLTTHYPNQGASSAVLANWCRERWPKVTTAEITRRMKRMERDGTVRRMNDVTFGEQYIWVLTRDDKAL